MIRQAGKAIILASLIAGCASKNEVAQGPIKSMVSSPASKSSEFSLRPYKLVTLENGMKLYFIEDTSLPRVSFQLLVKSGLLQEPKDLAGINAFTASMLEQGTQKRAARALAEEFGQLGTDLGVSPGADFTFLSVDSLSKDKVQLLNLFSDVVMNPAFKPSEIERIRSQIKAQVLKKVDNPSSYADDEFEKFLFGNHPYAKDVMGDVNTIKKIKKGDIIKHYLTWYRPNNSILAVVGHFPPEFETQVVDAFKSWGHRNLKPEVKGDIPEVTGTQVTLVSKPGLKQAQLRLGRPGVERKTDDFLALRAANEVLGGGMSSRLMQRVRDQLGLTYGISSGFDFRREKGSFVISTFTKNESVGQTLRETIDIYNNFVEKGIEERELNAAKAQMIANFPRALETADRFAYNLLVLDFYDIPFSYLTGYMKNVEKLSASDINKVIKKYLAKDQLKVLVYGDEKQIIGQIKDMKPQIVRIR